MKHFHLHFKNPLDSRADRDQRREVFHSRFFALVCALFVLGELVAPTPALAAASQLTLIWSSSDSTADGFKIERSTDAANFTQIAQIPSSPTSYSDTAIASCTTYYYRVRAYNSVGNSGYSNVGSGTAPCNATITATALPSTGGTTSGTGSFASGATATVSATPNACYNFVNWTEGGTVVSSSPSYSFTVTGNRSLVANFAATTYTVSTGVTPTTGGTATGGGSVNCGSSVTVSATPNAGYSFVNWSQNGTVVSTSASYTFTANANKNLIANFATATYAVAAGVAPSAGGSATGAGSFASGATATVSATPNACYNFVNWTEGGTVVGTSPSYSFTVTGNRSLVANFAATTYTVSTGVAPAASGSTTGGGTVNCGSSVTVSATPSAGYSFVNWTQNGTVVSTSAGYTFTANANKNLIANFASALPAPNGLSASAVSSNQINLSWNSVSAATGYKLYRGGTQIATCAANSYSDAKLAAGSAYCYAVAAVNGSATSGQSSSACESTLASPEPTTSPKSLAGIYNGLAIQTDAPSHASSGYLRLVLSRRGSFSATLIMGGARYAFNGQFDPDGNAMISIRRKYQSSLRVNLRLDLVGETEQITGTISDGVFTSAVLADRAVYGSDNPATAYMGRYTMVLAANTNNPAASPQGDGYGIVNVSTDGLLNMIGALGDGSFVSQSVPVSKYGTWPFYQVLDNGRASAIGWLSFTNVVDVSDFEGTIFWFNSPAPRDRYYPAGFTAEIAAVGAHYTNAPPWGTTVLNVSNTACNATVTLGDGNLATPLAIPVVLTPSNTVTVCGPNPHDVSLTVFPDSGRFVGSFLHPATRRTSFFAGTILQTQNYGAGNFRGTTRAGFVALEPTP